MLHSRLKSPEGKPLSSLAKFVNHEEIIRQGDEQCDTFYVPISGSFLCITALPDNTRSEIILPDNAPFGDLGFFGREMGRTATVQSIGESVCIVFHRRILESYPLLLKKISNNLHQISQEELKKSREDVIQLQQKNEKLSEENAALQARNEYLETQLRILEEAGKTFDTPH